MRILNPWSLLSKAVPDSRVRDFRFGMDLETIKSQSQQGRRGVRGVGSTEKLDIQKESVLQRGMDLRYFLRHGYYNDDHKPGAANKVGQPTVAEIRKAKNRDGKEVLALWTEGYLWKAGLHEGADRLWELTRAMEESQATRRMGFSIQGKVLERSGNKIVRAWVQDIAITPSPINTDTWLELTDELSKSVWVSDSELLDIHQSLTAHGFMDSELVDSEDWIEVDDVVKSLSAASAVSAGLGTESLESNLKVLPEHGSGVEKCEGSRDPSKSEMLKALAWVYEEARNRGHSPAMSRSMALATWARISLS